MSAVIVSLCVIGLIKKVCRLLSLLYPVYTIQPVVSCKRRFTVPDKRRQDSRNVSAPSPVDY